MDYILDFHIFHFMVRHYDGMKMRGMVMCRYRHTHSERRFEEGSKSLSKQRAACPMDTYLGMWAWKDLGGGAYAGVFSSWKDIFEATADLAHYAACNGWLSFD